MIISDQKHVTNEVFREAAADSSVIIAQSSEFLKVTLLFTQDV